MGKKGLTIQRPSKGTWAWKCCRFSSHHWCVSGLEKSAKAVKPGQTCGDTTNPWVQQAGDLWGATMRSRVPQHARDLNWG